MIEAHYLFGLNTTTLTVIHLQSIIHSMIELADSSAGPAGLAGHETADPVLPSWPRLETLAAPDLRGWATDLPRPDTNKYPCMELAYAAGRGGTMPAVLNAANESRGSTLEERIHFLDIPEVIEAARERHKPDLMNHPSWGCTEDRWARKPSESRRGRDACRSPPWRNEHPSGQPPSAALRL